MKYDPENELTKFNLSQFYQAKNDFNQALNYLEKINKNFEKNPQISYNKGFCFEKMNDFFNAEKNYQRAFEESNYGWFKPLEQFLLLSKNNEKKEEFIQKFYDFNKADAKNLNKFVLIASKRSDEQSKTQLNEVASLENHDSLIFNVGVAFMNRV